MNIALAKDLILPTDAVTQKQAFAMREVRIDAELPHVPNLDDLVRRFWLYVIPEPLSGCWLWSGAANVHGYGRIHVGRPSRRAMLCILRKTWKHL